MLAIRAARIFDGLRLHDRPQVLVAGDGIAEVDFTGAQPPPGHQLIDLGDATLLPGLIDTHMHLVFDASTDPAGYLRAVSDETLLEEARAAARRALDAGLTCVRDLGDRSFLGVRLREETAAKPGLGPDVVPAGPPTCSGRALLVLGGATRGAGAVRDADRDHADRGAAVIKVMVTGGHMTCGPDPGALAACQFSADELRAAADEAHRQGLPITAHAHGREGIVAALEGGFDGVEHASFLTPRGPEPDPRVIDALAASGTFVSTCIPGTVPGIPCPRHRRSPGSGTRPDAFADRRRYARCHRPRRGNRPPQAAPRASVRHYRHGAVPRQCRCAIRIDLPCSCRVQPRGP